MPTKNQIKELRLLRSKKHRLELQKYIAEGEKIVGEIIDLMPPSLIHVVCTDAYRQSLTRDVIDKLGTRLLVCEQETLDSISSLTTPSPALAVMRLPAANPKLKIESGLNLYLDGIRDPGNLGTILRIADWFGVPVFLSDDCVDIYNPKTIQASMGAFLRVTASTSSLVDLQKQNAEVQVIGTVIDQGQDALSFNWPTCSLLVIGSESHGVREENVPMIGTWLSIPRGTGTVRSESLNAAVATGILCSSHLHHLRKR